MIFGLIGHSLLEVTIFVFFLGKLHCQLLIKVGLLVLATAQIVPIVYVVDKVVLSARLFRKIVVTYVTSLPVSELIVLNRIRVHCHIFLPRK